MDTRPLIVGIGGTTRPQSSTEIAIGHVLRRAEELGAQTLMFGGSFLSQLPHYQPDASSRSDVQRRLVDAVRSADGIVIASPGYHGCVTGLVKNALDLLEDLRADTRPYLDGRAVACIATAGGQQAGVSTLTALRSIVHALRGWPTPLGAALLTTAESGFDEQGRCRDPRTGEQLDAIAFQVVDFARRHTLNFGAADPL